MTPKRSKSKDRHERDTEIALFRYGLVAQLIHDPPEPGQQEQLLREIASKTYRIPYSSRTTGVCAVSCPVNVDRATRDRTSHRLAIGC